MNDASNDKITRYEDFWPYYLREHAKPGTRILHYVGTALALLACLYAIVAQAWWFLLAMPLSGYFFAWVGHFFVEKNKPATFTYPFWSLISDFRMFFTWVSGRMPRELEKAGLEPRAV